MPRSAFRLLVIVALVAGSSWLAREMQHQRIPDPEAGWVSLDPDSLYHFRRVHRLLTEGFPVDGRDPYLDFPQGSPIPWPPYYTLIAGAALAPFAPEDPEELRSHVERGGASLPLLFGVLTSVLAAGAGGLLAGAPGAVIAGGTHALSAASIAYSKSGNGDHHAWVTLLAGTMLVLLSAGLARGAAARTRPAIVWGTAAGAVAGLALGSWVAAVLYVIPVQLALAWLVFHNVQRPLPGLAPLGLAFHGTAILALLPAAAGSPWNDVSPWVVVNLSWFHPAWLALGALVFAPLLVERSPRARRVHPWAVAAALGLLGGFVALSESAPAAGVREGFSWLSRGDDFMASVWESRALLGQGAVRSIGEELGFGVFLLPFAWLAAAIALVRRGRIALLPWVVATPLLFVEAARQFRFADALSLPMAVLLGWGAVAAFGSARFRASVPKRSALGRLPPVVVLIAAAAGAVALQWPTASKIARGLLDPADRGMRERESSLTMREMCEWIRRSTPPSGDYSVLASWFWGHSIEWAADRPTVATNFGTYLGEDSFRDPSRFFLAEDPVEAAAILARRHSRYVVLTSDLTGGLDKMIRAAAPERASRYLDPGDGIQLRAEWFATLGARLMFDGMIFSYEGPRGRPLDFLRLVHVSPRRDPRMALRGDPSPTGWVWEHVPGAIVEASGRPGTMLTVEIRVRYGPGRYALTWKSFAPAGADGTARIRVPYATEGRNGDGIATGPARWTFGPARGTVTIPEGAVLGGGVTRVL